MRVAFDVNGTLKGSSQDKVRKLFQELKNRGHSVIIWSNCYSYAVDMADELGHTKMETKFSKLDAKNGDYELMDLAIEDESEQRLWLGAKRFILVDEIPDDAESFVAFLQQFELVAA